MIENGRCGQDPADGAVHWHNHWHADRIPVGGGDSVRERSVYVVKALAVLMIPILAAWLKIAAVEIHKFFR